MLRYADSIVEIGEHQRNETIANTGKKFLIYLESMDTSDQHHLREGHISDFLKTLSAVGANDQNRFEEMAYRSFREALREIGINLKIFFEVPELDRMSGAKLVLSHPIQRFVLQLHCDRKSWLSSSAITTTQTTTLLDKIEDGWKDLLNITEGFLEYANDVIDDNIKNVKAFVVNATSSGTDIIYEIAQDIKTMAARTLEGVFGYLSKIIVQVVKIAVAVVFVAFVGLLICRRCCSPALSRRASSTALSDILEKCSSASTQYQHRYDIIFSTKLLFILSRRILKTVNNNTRT